MEIYIVQPGDTIYSIANKYGISISKLLLDNGIENPFNLVTGQALIITYPSQIYTVKEGDTLAQIAAANGITIMQLLRNNSFLATRKDIYPGETLVISYNVKNDIVVNGYAYPFIGNDTLIRTLPYLTYLSIFNYRIAPKGSIITYSDDRNIIQKAIDYGTIPLLMISSLSPHGETDLETAYDILLNEEYHTILSNNLLALLKTTGYYGLNIMISIINNTNQYYYMDLLYDISIKVRNEGYRLFVTIDPDVHYVDGVPAHEDIDYARISQLVDGITFLQYSWGNSQKPPAPVCSIELLNHFIAHTVQTAPSENITIGKPLLGFDWELPFVPGKTIAHSLTLNAAIILAADVSAVIKFDEASQTPFYYYKGIEIGATHEHIVWFIDVRSIDALDKLIDSFRLEGSGVWNIMIFYQQMWSLIISKYGIIKLIPDSLE
jgi:spore germination protein